MKPLLVHTAYEWGRLTEGWIADQVFPMDGWQVVALAARCSPGTDRRLVRCLAHDAPLAFFVDRLWARVTRTRWPTPYRRVIEASGWQELRPTLFHAHFGEWAYALLPLARNVGARMVASFYGYDAGSLPRRSGWRRRLAELFEAVVAVVVEGPAMQARLQALGCPPEKIALVPLGVDLTRWPERPRRLQLPRALRLLTVASLREKKGVDDAIRLFARARGWLPQGSSLIVVGDGPLRPQLLQLAESLRVQEAIEWKGYLPLEEVRHLLYAADVLIQPSITASDGDTEGGAPVILLQAAAAGLPVVATRHADIPFVVLDGVTGCLAEERDVQGLEEALRAVLDRYEALSANARVLALERFSLELMRARLRQVYEAAIVGSPHP